MLYMILIEHRGPGNAAATEQLQLPFELRCKSRLRTRLASGEEVGLFLERGTVLRAGDRLLANDGRVVEVMAAPEQVMDVRSGDRASAGARRLSPRQPPRGGANCSPAWCALRTTMCWATWCAGWGWRWSRPKRRSSPRAAPMAATAVMPTRTATAPTAKDAARASTHDAADRR